MPNLRISPRDRYVAHKATAKRRGIAFELTFEEWLEIWENSGHFKERGRRVGQYHMARHGDRGPYAVGNVKIITGSQNVSESKGARGFKHPPMSAEHRKNLSEAHIGKTPSPETRQKLSAAMYRRWAKARLSLG